MLLNYYINDAHKHNLNYFQFDHFNPRIIASIIIMTAKIFTTLSAKGLFAA